jgi:RimJ/RimL family protein N-acetyltransferase
MKNFLETQRLSLRQFTEDDGDALFALDSDPDVMRFIGPYLLPDAAAYRDRIRTKYLPYYMKYAGYGYWAAVEKSSGVFLGWFLLRPALDSLFAVETGYQATDLELGYRLLKSAWGKGYATEASRALVHKAFMELGATCVVASALAGNLASLRVMEKVGLRRAGEYRIPGYDMPSVKCVLSREQYVQGG